MINLLLPALFLFAAPEDAAPSLNPKYEHTKQIFERLVEARGDKSLKDPELVWTVESSNGAFYQPGTNQITFEEKAYDICARFGPDTDNALAYIISHELVHYYKQHGWEAQFARKFAGQQMGEDVGETVRDMKQQETESDLLGGFLAYTGGYNTVGIAPKLLPALYDGYGWPRENPRYPTMQERVLLAETTARDLSNLIGMFETANFLVAVGRFDDAVHYYDHVLSFYKSRELVNNLGVVTCMVALELFEKSDLEYLYPLELDAESRVRTGSKGSQTGTGEGIKAIRDSLLQSAIDLFSESLSLDREYHTARLNLASAYALLALSSAGFEEEKELNYDFSSLYARQVIRRAEKESDAKLKCDALNLMGIIAARTGEGDPASLFGSAMEKSMLAEHNLNVWKKTPGTSSVSRKPRGMIPEQIEDFEMDRFILRPVPDTMIAIKGLTKRQWGFKQKDLSGSRILIDFVSPTRYAFFQLTGPGYNGKTLLGLEAGAGRKEILEKYLDPDGEIQLPNGHLMIYRADQIIFWLDQDQKLARWCIYRVKPEAG